jgi:hypothetical protein
MLGNPWFSLVLAPFPDFSLVLRLGFPWISLDSFVRIGTFQRVMGDVRDGSNSQARLLLPRPKAIRGAAAPLGRKEAVPSRTEGIPSWAEGNPSQSEGNPNQAEGNPSRAEGIPNVCPSVKSRYFNGLPAGGLGVTDRDSFGYRIHMLDMFSFAARTPSSKKLRVSIRWLHRLHHSLFLIFRKYFLGDPTSP